jgi:hypothetical protein
LVPVTGEISYELTDHGGRDASKTNSSATLIFINAEAKEPSITLKANLHRKKPFHSSIFDSSKDAEVEELFLFRLCDTTSCIFLDHELENRQDVYTFDVLGFPHGPLYEGFGYPRWPRGRGAATLKLLLQRVENRPDTFRRIGLGIVPGEPSKSWDVFDDDEAMTSSRWLVTDDEIFTDREFTLI